MKTLYVSDLDGTLLTGQKELTAGNRAALEKAAETALEMTHAAIVETVNSGEHLRYGMQFEKVLPLFWQKLGL